MHALRSHCQQSSPPHTQELTMTPDLRLLVADEHAAELGGLDDVRVQLTVMVRAMS